MDVTENLKGARFGPTVPIASMNMCVVYDAASGQIHHHHSVLTLVGGAEPSPEQIAQDALQACAERREPFRQTLDILHVDHHALEPGTYYRVIDGKLRPIQSDDEKSR